MKGLIAAGGKATRMRPITHAINKHLIPVAGKPLIEHAILKMKDAGITEIGININPGDMEMKKALGDGSRYGVHLTYLEQEGGPRGVGHIPMNARWWLGDESFVFYLGDNIVLGPITRLIKRFQDENLDALLALARVDGLQRFGVPEFENGKLVRVIEKPENPPSPFAVTGIYVYKPSMFEAADVITPSARGEYEISDIHSVMIQQGKNVGHEEVTGWWMDTGKPEDLLKGNHLLLEQVTEPIISPEAMIDPGAKIEGAVSIGRGTHVSAGSVIIGPSWIGEGCDLDHAEIGPGASLGHRVTVRGANIRDSIVMDDAVMTGNFRMHDSIIGRHAVISGEGDRTESSRFLLGDHGVIELKK
jgi:glucose-1-phosphate thymidylyltransferase